MIKRLLGIDFFDLAIHVGVTFCVGVLAIAAWGPVHEEEVLATVLGLSLIALAWRRNRALKGSQLDHEPGEADRLADLEGRMAELEQLQSRLFELEERLDFTERMLAQQREPLRIEGGREQR